MSSECRCCSTNEVHCQEKSQSIFFKFLPSVASFVLLVGGIVADIAIQWDGWWRLLYYLAAYAPVGYGVIRETVEMFAKGDIFNEFSLMSLATVGAFIIGEYPEGVAVMLFYAIGELFQDGAVNRVRRSIKALLDVRPDTATVYSNGIWITLPPEKINIGEKIKIIAGEKVALDGRMLSAGGSFNTAALTGEPTPRTIYSGEQVLAGMVAIDSVVEIEVEKEYSDSSLSKILNMVEQASERKAKGELWLRRFARIYTPVVFALAAMVIAVPLLFVDDYVLAEWVYRALVLLVISCPCALVISVPLSYFAGIGAASRAGILFKGANFIDMMARLDSVVLDKTGTLTRGVFKVQEVVGDDPEKIVRYAWALEANSTHPVARAISQYSHSFEQARDIEETAGLGISGIVDEHKIVVGNTKFFNSLGMTYNPVIDTVAETTVIVGVDGQYIGYIILGDELKPDARNTIADLYALGIRHTVVLSGDKSAITALTAQKVGITESYGDLLPADKTVHIERLKSTAGTVAFVGDGINDTPSLALADIGIAMGCMGSDAAIEVADVVVQTDSLHKIVDAVRISRRTKRIVIQNIALALGIKIVVIVLGGFGFVSMWAAVIADVGASLLAIFNAIRILKIKVS